MNLIVNNIESEWTIFLNVSYDVLVEKENSIYSGNQVITYISTSNYTKSSTNRTRQQIIHNINCLTWNNFNTNSKK